MLLLGMPATMFEEESTRRQASEVLTLRDR
jgi:hypothetical protein